MTEYELQWVKLAKAIDEFPPEFGLRAYPGDTFRISTLDSYVNSDGVVVMYCDRKQEDSPKWVSFGKLELDELQEELRYLSTTPAPTESQVRAAIGTLIVAYSHLERSRRGDQFATDRELEFIASDPLGWLEFLHGQDAWQLSKDLLDAS